MNTLFGAQFSDDRKYRYSLWRIWDQTKPLVMFIGLNPSAADETKNDPTIKRLIAIVNGWGDYYGVKRFGGFIMTNVFALVTPYPDELLKVDDPLGDNWAHLENISLRCEIIVFCWGNFKVAREQSLKVENRFPKSYCLGCNKNGSPKHPLYLNKKTRYQEYL